MWLAHDRQLAIQVKQNRIGGQIAVIIGLDELYGKKRSTKNIQDPTQRLIHMNTIFWFSLGGSVEGKENSGHNNDISTLMAKLEATYEINKPAVQFVESSDSNVLPELEIQNNMD